MTVFWLRLTLYHDTRITQETLYLDGKKFEEEIST